MLCNQRPQCNKTLEDEFLKVEMSLALERDGSRRSRRPDHKTNRCWPVATPPATHTQLAGDFEESDDEWQDTKGLVDSSSDEEPGQIGDARRAKSSIPIVVPGHSPAVVAASESPLTEWPMSDILVPVPDADDSDETSWAPDI